MDWTGIGGIVAALAVGIWRGLDKWAEHKKVKAAGLNDNPIRCQEHQARLEKLDEKLGALEQRAARLETRMDNLELCAQEIKAEIKELRK